MLGMKRTRALRYVAVVFCALWLFFLGFALLIRGPHISNTQVFWSSVFLSAVVTLSSFAGGWAVKRCERNQQEPGSNRPKGPDSSIFRG